MAVMLRVRAIHPYYVPDVAGTIGCFSTLKILAFDMFSARLLRRSCRAQLYLVMIIMSGG
jgi:hypothetical protein